MIATWLGVASLALLASAYVVLRARRKRTGADAGGAPAALVRQRQELEAEALAQGLDRDDAQALGEELALDALDQPPAVPPSEESPPAVATVPLLPLLLGALVAAGASVGLYALWGEPHADALAGVERLMTLASEGDDAAQEQLLDALASRTQRKPNDRDSWFLLGHSRMRDGDFEGAAAAFERLHGLAGGNPQVDLAWLQARYLADGGRISEAARPIAERALASNANQPELLELLAMDALRQSDFASGARHLVRALGQPMPMQRRRLLTETLALARTRLDPQRPLIEVAVEASWEGPQAPWLMLFARPASGGMPLAATRVLAEPSQTVILDDATTMVEGGSLRESGLLRVVARLSESGEASAADAQAASEELVDPAEQPRIRLRLGEPATTANAEDEDGPGVNS